MSKGHLGLIPKWLSDIYMSKGHYACIRARAIMHDGGNFSPLQRISISLSLLKDINIVSVVPRANIMCWKIYTPKTLS